VASRGWTLDLAKMKIPDAKASGKMHGIDFVPDKVELTNGILKFRQGKEFFADVELSIFMLLSAGETVAGKSYRINSSDSATGFGNPQIHMDWKPKGEQVPKTGFNFENYAMVLEFGKAEDGAIPGRIYVCLTDASKSYLAGTFTVAVMAAGRGRGGE